MENPNTPTEEYPGTCSHCVSYQPLEPGSEEGVCLKAKYPPVEPVSYMYAADFNFEEPKGIEVRTHWKHACPLYVSK